MSVRILHIFPTFKKNGKGHARFDDMPYVRGRVSVVDRKGKLNLMPTGKTKVTQAFPNQDYLVGGCQESKFGWCVEVPERARNLEFSILWEFDHKDGNGGIITRHIHHHFDCKLIPGEGNVHSMDSGTWEGNEAPSIMMASGTLSELAVSSYRLKKTIKRFERERNVLHIGERLKLPATTFESGIWLSQWSEIRGEKAQKIAEAVETC